MIRLQIGLKLLYLMLFVNLATHLLSSWLHGEFEFSKKLANLNPVSITSKGLFVREIDSNETMWSYPSSSDKYYLSAYIQMKNEGVHLINCSIFSANKSVMANEFNCLNASNRWLRNDYYQYCLRKLPKLMHSPEVDSIQLFQKMSLVDFYNTYNLREFTRQKKILELYRIFLPRELFKIDNIIDFAKKEKCNIVITDSKRLLNLLANYEYSKVMIIPKVTENFGYRFGSDNKTFYCVNLKTQF